LAGNDKHIIISGDLNLADSMDDWLF